ncbi:hypothetical protein [Methylocaldum marinum]|uniref:hypothetical protein n=1 Tax=Methylocaldum marinum TaxID=1432792 RepID=UPI001472FC6A|nr:hypothetical protein [Methylocaldum marinum]
MNFYLSASKPRVSAPGACLGGGNLEILIEDRPWRVRENVNMSLVSSGFFA